MAHDEVVTGHGRPPTGTKVQVRIPAELLERVAADARAAQVPRAEVIRRIIADHYNDKEQS